MDAILTDNSDSNSASIYEKTDVPIHMNSNSITACRLNDAELVSEDELSATDQTTVAYAEEVSDDELPGPNLADLPADTEIISEDEFPTAGKRKACNDTALQPSSDLSADKRMRTIDEEFNQKDTLEIKLNKTVLPDLDKYWEPLRGDPSDFTGWTYLLQYVDQENDIDAAREAYDSFLGHYPYCYGYWRKYADYEKRKGNYIYCEKVFERGLKAVPLSVDLWLHFLSYFKQTHGSNERLVREQFVRATESCGLEFRSDKLWEAFIKWETDGKRWLRVINVYDSLLATPTQGYNGHFDKFKEIVNNHPAQMLVSNEEYLLHRSKLQISQLKNSTNGISDMQCVVESSPLNGNLETITTDCDDDTKVPDEMEMQAIRERIIAARQRIHKHTIQAVTDRWAYEEGIKRPYFHVKPLERCQLMNWKDYLDYEIEAGDHRRVLVLFERCLIACALYDEFWLKFIRYLESRRNTSDSPGKSAYTVHIRSVFERACLIHHKDKPALHMLWASFEESYDNSDRASEILRDLDGRNPNLLQIAYRRCNLERRRGNYTLVAKLYETYIQNARTQANETGKHKSIESCLVIKYARFMHRIKGNFDASVRILRDALDRDRYNTRLALQFIDLALQRTPNVDKNEIINVIDSFIKADTDDVDLDQRVLFAQRKVEFLDDFGNCALQLQNAQRELQTIMSKANEAKNTISEPLPCQIKPNNSSASTPADSSLVICPYTGRTSSSTYFYYGQQPYKDGYNYNQQWQVGTYSQWSGYHNTSSGGSSGYY